MKEYILKDYLYGDVDPDDEVPDEMLGADIYGSEEDLNLDDPDELVNDEDEEEIVVKGSLISVLRSELMKPEYDRGSLDFKYKGETYEGVPMLDMNPKNDPSKANKFIFSILPEKKLKSFDISEIVVLD